MHNRTKKHVVTKIIEVTQIIILVTQFMELQALQLKKLLTIVVVMTVLKHITLKLLFIILIMLIGTLTFFLTTHFQEQVIIVRWV